MLIDAGYMWEEVEKERERRNMEKIPEPAVMERPLELALQKGPLKPT